VVATRPDGAIADAREIDRRVARGEDPGPLTGLPFLVKDIEDAAGLPTTFGSLLFADAPPAVADGIAAARLRRAGAILVGKTNTPEFAMAGHTANRLFGATVNPWAEDWSPGGSSGGSGAAVSAGLAPIATATDVGGSIRIPAALCGLVGLKPSGGRIGRDPILGTPDMNHLGPLATTVADARLLLGVLGGPARGDPFSLPPMPLRPLRMPARIVAAERVVDGPPLGPDVARLFSEALAGVERDLGLPVERIGPGQIFPSGYDPDDWFRIIAVDQLAILGREFVTRNLDRVSDGIRGDLEAALGISVDDYAGARLRRYRYARELDDVLGDDTLLLLPSLTVEGWTPDGELPDSPGQGLPGWVFYMDPANFGGQPAASVPAGHGPHGVPFGLAVMGPRFADELVLGFAAAWESVRPWPLSAPGWAPFGLD
jgi:Asp-tRNA(Asn)/Glu-tRNA(Gln) amidotransferase A subunit family amidase